jgi:hypothetical protein
MDSLEAFVADLARTTIGGTVNFYRTVDLNYEQAAGPAIRQANLLAYLTSRQHPQLMLVGEAPGYQGARFSGVAFTSERSLPATQRTSLRPEGWSEPSATIIHGALALHGLEETTVLWNACPLHPAKVGLPLSNRTPTETEIALGLPWLSRLVALLEPGLIVCLGRTAQKLLPGAPAIRHPANGGATLCRMGLADLVTQGLVRPQI